jgi:hypothetical protein
MIYIYKDGKLVTKGTNIAFTYLNDDNEVIAKSPDKQEVEGAVTVIGQIKDDTFNTLVPKDRKAERGYYHKLKDGDVDGKKISDYEKAWDLGTLKAEKNIGIDDKTSQIIYYGIPFDGHLFDTSAESQRDWLGLYSLRDDVTYPFAVTTKDEKEYYFQSSDGYAMFFKTGTAFINGTVASGRAIKLQVMACATKDEIDAIVDPR